MIKSLQNIQVGMVHLHRSSLSPTPCLCTISSSYKIRFAILNMSLWNTCQIGLHSRLNTYIYCAYCYITIRMVVTLIQTLPESCPINYYNNIITFYTYVLPCSEFYCTRTLNECGNFTRYYYYFKQHSNIHSDLTFLSRTPLI